MAKHKLGFLAALGFAAQPVEQVAATLAEIGYGSVEWTLSHFNPTTMSPAELEAVVATTTRHGLVTSELVVQQDLITLDEPTWNERVQLTEACIRAAGDSGIGVVNLFSGPAPWDPSAPVVNRDIAEQQAWEMLFRSFDRLLPVAENHHVCLAVEAVFGMLCRDYYTTRVLFDRYDSPSLGINMDPSHYALYRNDITWVVREWGHRIKHVHLKDVIGMPGAIGESFTFPLIGEGIIDWPSFVRTLDDIGYSGPLSIEFEAFTYYRNVLRSDPSEAARRSYLDVHALLDDFLCD